MHHACPCSPCHSGTQQALALVAAGRHQVALGMYSSVLEASDKLQTQLREQQEGQGQLAGQALFEWRLGPAGVPSVCEEGLVYSQRLHCMQQLAQWDAIQEQVSGELLSKLLCVIVVQDLYSASAAYLLHSCLGFTHVLAANSGLAVCVGRG